MPTAHVWGNICPAHSPLPWSKCWRAPILGRCCCCCCSRCRVPIVARLSVVGRGLPTADCRLPTADCRCLTQLSKALNYGRAGCQLNEQHVAATLPTQQKKGKEKQQQKQQQKQKQQQREKQKGKGQGKGRRWLLRLLVSWRYRIWSRLLGHGIDPQATGLSCCLCLSCRRLSCELTMRMISFISHFGFIHWALGQVSSVPRPPPPPPSVRLSVPLSCPPCSPSMLVVRSNFIIRNIFRAHTINESRHHCPCACVCVCVRISACTCTFDLLLLFLLLVLLLFLLLTGLVCRLECRAFPVRPHSAVVCDATVWGRLGGIVLRKVYQAPW